MGMEEQLGRSVNSYTLRHIRTSSWDSTLKARLETKFQPLWRVNCDL